MEKYVTEGEIRKRLKELKKRYYGGYFDGAIPVAPAPHYPIGFGVLAATCAGGCALSYLTKLSRYPLGGTIALGALAIFCGYQAFDSFLVSKKIKKEIGGLEKKLKNKEFLKPRQAL